MSGQSGGGAKKRRAAREVIAPEPGEAAVVRLPSGAPAGMSGRAAIKAPEQRR